MTPDMDKMDKETNNAAKKLPYKAPKLKREGTVEDLTQAEYGGLNKVLLGSIFSIASPSLPGAPSR